MNADDRHYHLQFEIRDFDDKIALTDNSVVKIRTRNMQQHFRRWHFVPAHQLKDTLVTSVRDKSGLFYVTDTRFYVPFWLRAIPIDLPANEMLPVDTYNVPNCVKNNEASITEQQIPEYCAAQTDAAHNNTLKYSDQNAQLTKYIRQYDRNSTMYRRYEHLPALNDPLDIDISNIHNESIQQIEQPQLNSPLTANGCLSILHSADEHDRICENKNPINNQNIDLSFNDPVSKVLAEIHNWSLTDDSSDGSDQSMVQNTRSPKSYCASFSAKLNQLNFTPTLNNFTMQDKSEFTEPAKGDSLLFVTDLKLIAQFVDDMLDYDDYKNWLIDQEDEVKQMLKDAIEKTMAERINLDARGVVGDPRLAQIVNRYSLNTVHVSEAARDARNKYNLNAKRWNESRTVEASAMCDEAKSAFDRIVNQRNFAPFIKTHFKYFETAAELRDTTIYKDMVNKLCEN